MPLDHQAGEAQVDFGYALAKVSGFFALLHMDGENVII
jgi:hypothetical protein